MQVPRLSMRLVALAALLLLSSARGAEAWGYDVHRFIMDRAVDLLPAELRPLFERNRAIVVERAIDPDTWRTAGFESEDPHHFINIDWDGYGAYPFAELPRDYAAAVSKFGRSRIEQNGTLPWRIEEFYGNLRRTFEAYRRPTALTRFNILLFAASVSHYVADALQPFHGVINYDGQVTGQRGVHARFETALFERYRAQLALAPPPMPPVRDVRAFAFDRIVESAQLVPRLLQADREAIGARDAYDDVYFAAFFASVRPVLERRLSEAVAASAALIAGAWEAAGRPPLPTDLPPFPPQRRRP
ncbi:MAG: hypothetical protein HY824_07940 [Acidobacteria bacterium]|nr:hypothetical protein [Acidobacteriota bacterium]